MHKQIIENFMKTSNLSDRIALLRSELGLTYEQLGDLAGISKNAARKWETGATKNIKHVHLQRLANHTGYSLSWIMSGIGGKKRNNHDCIDISNLSAHDKKTIRSLIQAMETEKI